MKDLHRLFDNLGFDKVHTYMQSGNILFKSAEDAPTVLAAAINQKVIH